MLADGYVDIIQPDPSHAGGITEMRKIAAMAEAYDVALAPHCPLGPIALAACLQLDAVCYNAFIQEQSLGIHYNEGNDLLDYSRTRTRPYSPTRTVSSRSRRGRGSGSRSTRPSVIERAGWPSLAQPDLAPCGRQLRRVVNGSNPVRARRSGSIAHAAFQRLTHTIAKRRATSTAF